MCFVPMYIAPKLKKMVLGQPIHYRADEPMEQERLRIKEELMGAVTRLGRSLPPHTVVPYAVIPRKDYPSSQGDQQKGR